MLARLKLAQQTLEAQTQARNEAWLVQKEALEAKRTSEIAAAQEFAEQEKLRAEQAEILRAAIEKQRKQQAERERLQAALAGRAGDSAGTTDTEIPIEDQIKALSPEEIESIAPTVETGINATEQ